MLKKALTVTALLVLTACGGMEVDVDVVETSIVDGVDEELGVEATVDCPAQVDWAVGGTFTCDVSGVEGATTATVTMEDEDGNVTWKLS